MPTARRRSPIATALAVVLALESVAVVAVRAGELRALSTEPPATAVTRSTDEDTTRLRPAVARLGPATQSPLPAGTPATDALLVAPVRGPIDNAPTSRAVESAPAAKPRPAVPAAAATKVTSARAAPTRPAATGSRTFHGRNHVWSPALGIDKKVYAFACSRSEYPGNVVYRWGCGGHNNVYLFGHAANVFAGLNRAYSNGSLKPGLKVYYADGNGTVRTYAVRWWKVVYPTPDAAWAWASLSRPSMTLQTCVGKNSEKRLMVRLVQVAG